MSGQAPAWPGLPMGQHYKVTMSAHCYLSVPILICTLMLAGRKTPTTNHSIQSHLVKSMSFCQVHVHMLGPSGGRSRSSHLDLDLEQESPHRFLLFLFFVLFCSSGFIALNNMLSVLLDWSCSPNDNNHCTVWT